MLKSGEILDKNEYNNAIFYFEQNIKEFNNSKYITYLFQIYKNIANLKVRATITLWLDYILFNDIPIQKNIKKKVYNFLSKLDGIRSANMVLYKRRNHLDD